jgi:hypothetical protein
MKAVEGTFQYFYCTRSLSDLPHPDVPTRDVTDTWRRGNKTEPYLEKRVENWCSCRARFITAAAKRANATKARKPQRTRSILLTSAAC